MTPFVGAAFQGHAMFGRVTAPCGATRRLFVVAARSGRATILFC